MIDKRLIKLVPESKKYVFLTVLLKLISLLANILLIFSVANILRLSGICGEPPSSQGFIFSCVMIALTLILSFLSAYFASITSFKSSRAVKKILRSKIYQKLLKLGPDYQEKTETAKIIQLAVEGVEQIEVWFGQYLPQFFYSMIAAFVTFAILAFINLKMALILLVCIPFIPMSIVAVQKIAKKILKKYLDQYAVLADNYLENLQGLPTLQLYKADEDRQQKLRIEAEKFRKVTMKVLSFQLNSIIIMDIVAYAGAALGIIAAVTACINGILSLDKCFVCILISADFFIPLRRLGSYFHTAMNGTSASKNIFALLETKETEDGSLELPETDDNSKLFECEGLSYSFNQRQVLENVNISIKKGSYVAFVGKSGSGKSTSAKVLSGIYNEYSGQVKIMGLELSAVKRESLYKYVSYISHKDWIFKGSIKDCLLEGKSNASEEELWEALAKVRLDSFVKDNGGLEMQILENASNLSGGQKQRLSIARALLHNSELYIFDEATSNIDLESEEAILALLHKLKGTKTVIMISHRKENCLGADKIYLFENGHCSQLSEVAK